MAEPILRSMKSWILAYVLWDDSGKSLQGIRRSLWAMRKVLVAFLASTVLTWREWVEHHPPEIAIIAVLHFVFVLVAVALLVRGVQFFLRRNQPSQGGI
jgi:hypothetical protein